MPRTGPPLVLRATLPLARPPREPLLADALPTGIIADAHVGALGEVVRLLVRRGYLNE